MTWSCMYVLCVSVSVSVSVCVRRGVVGSVVYGVVLLVWYSTVWCCWFSTGAWYNCSLLSLSRTLQGQVQVVSLVKSGTFTSVVRVCESRWFSPTTF